MYLQYIPNRFVDNAFLTAPNPFTNSLLDEFGMIPYENYLPADEKKSGLGNADFVETTEDESDELDLTASRFDLKDNDISIAFVRDVLMKKCGKKSFHQDIKFMVKNTLARIKVEALLYGGTLSCSIISSNDDLRRRLSMEQKEAARELCRSLNMFVELRVSDEILLGRL